MAINNNSIIIEDDNIRVFLQLALAFGSFAIGTCEFVAMGVLPEMAQSSHVPIATAGQYIAAYAFGVVIGAPLLAIITAKMKRKSLLIALMLFYALSNLAVCFSNSYSFLIFFRFISGLPHGVYFGTATLVASSIVPLNDQSKAVGNVMLGLTIAVVIGAPFATLLAQSINWHIAYMLVAVLALLSAIMVWKKLPHDLVFFKSSPLNELNVLKEFDLWIIMSVVIIGAAGLFTVFSYIKLIYMKEAGFSLNSIPFLMPMIGVGMVLGNIIGPRLAKKIDINFTIVSVTIYSALAYFAFYWLCQNKIGAVLGSIAIGLNFASMPSMQVKIFSITSKAKTLAGALLQASYNLANFIGAWGGALLLKANYSYATTALLASLLTTIGGIIYFKHFQKR